MGHNLLVAWSAPMVVITTVLVLVTLGVAWVTLLSAQATRRTCDSGIFDSFRKDYNSPEMRNSIRSLAELYRENREDFMQQWTNSQQSDTEFFERIDLARRRVTTYYTDIAKLFEGDVLTRRFARVLCANYGLNVFYKVCVPLNVAMKAKRPTAPERYAKVLRRIRVRYGNGEIF